MPEPSAQWLVRVLPRSSKADRLVSAVAERLRLRMAATAQRDRLPASRDDATIDVADLEDSANEVRPVRVRGYADVHAARVPAGTRSKLLGR